MMSVVFLYFIFCLMSCGSETEEVCMAPLISENLKGSWDVETSEMSPSNKVTFRSDRTGTNDTNTGPFVCLCYQNDEEIKDFN